MLIAIASDKFQRAWPENPEQNYEVLDVADALRRVWDSDAHFVAYVATGAEYQPRIRKASSGEWTGGALRLSGLVADVDNAGHAPWDAAGLAAFEAMRASVGALATCGVYLTAHGYRLVQPLDESVPVADAERCISAWLETLRGAGVAADMACRDWTRHFRLPHVRRGGAAWQSPLVDLSGMRAISVVPTPLASGVRLRVARPVRAEGSGIVCGGLSDAWSRGAVVIGSACRDVASEWHSLFLAVGGALLEACVAEGLVVGIVVGASIAAGDGRVRDRETGARSSVAAWEAGQPVAGRGWLRRHAPGVGDAVDDAVALAAGWDDTRPLEIDVVGALRDAIEGAAGRDGVTLVGAECGLGKTWTVQGVAARRGGAGELTAISVDKNALAIQVAEGIRGLGVGVRRVYGALSVLGANGKPICRYAEAATPMVAGGQSIEFLFCKRCEVRDNCVARAGADGDDDASVVVGTHAMIGGLSATAGKRGLLVIDEPPPLSVSVTYSLARLTETKAMSTSFDGVWCDVLGRLIDATMIWALQKGAGGDWHSAVGADLVAAVSALEGVPAIQGSIAYAARRVVGQARALGRASQVMRDLVRLARAREGFEVLAGEGGEFMMRLPNDSYLGALRRDGSTLVLDVGAAALAVGIGVAVGAGEQGVPFFDFRARDGAPITRTLLRSSTANRRGWWAGGELTPAFWRAMRRAAEWVDGLRLSDGASVALISYKSVEDDAAVRAWWTSRLSNITLVWGHYYGTDGLNTMIGVDALVTLGDPFKNIVAVASACRTEGTVWGGAVEKDAAIELEQCHGRLRAPHRNRPAAAAHLGRVRPRGTGWLSHSVEEAKRGSEAATGRGGAKG